MDFISNKSITLPLLGLGTFTMHGEQLRNVVTNALKLGYTLFDTAVKYGNEKELGLILKSSHNKVLSQTKVHDMQLLGNLRYLRLNKKSVKKSFALSKERLGFAPEVYLLHSPFKGYEKSFGKLISLRENGETKAIGICNISLDRLQNLIKETGLKPDVVQVEIHPYYNNRELIDYCKDKGIIVEARSPLAHGDALQEWQSNKVLQSISSNYGISIPQVILRWITQQNVSVIVRTTNLLHLKENIDIFNISFTNNDMKEIYSLNKNISYGYKSTKIN